MMKRILQFVFTGIIVYSIVNICVYFFVLHNAAAEYTQLQMNAVPSMTEEDEYTDDYVYTPLCSDISIDYQKMKSESADYIGWLNIKDTKISYPVMFCEGDNDFYLHHLPNGTKNFAGSLFLDGNSTGIDSENLIIYGHNMKNGSMFGRLKKFTDEEYFENHPYIELHTERGIRYYLIFSVRKVLKSDAKTFVVDGFQASDYAENAISENSFSYKTLTRGFDFDEIAAHTTPQIITLSTCTGDSSYRLVVNAVRVK